VNVYCWDRFDDDSYGGGANAAVIAATPEAARALVRAVWREHAAAHGLDPDVAECSDDSTFYGIGAAGFYAPGVVRGLQKMGPPDRVIALVGADVAPQIVLLHKGYEG
jgi:hypothetical protein